MVIDIFKLFVFLFSMLSDNIVVNVLIGIVYFEELNMIVWLCNGSIVFSNVKVEYMYISFYLLEMVNVLCKRMFMVM